MQKSVSVKKLVVCALLAALYGVLAGPLSFYAGSWKISLAFTPICIASILYGPVYGGLTGLTGDLISVLLILRNAFNPFFTLSAICTGVLPWVVFKLLRGDYRHAKWWQIAFSVAVTILICSFFLNSLWMVLFFGTTPAIFFTRLGVNVVMIPIHTLVITLMFKTVIPRVKVN